MGDLGTSYVAAWVGDVITHRAPRSARSGARWPARVGAARLLFALGRDGVLPRALGAGRAAPRHAGARHRGRRASRCTSSSPWPGSASAATRPTLFVASGTIGTLILLVVYALATVGAAKLLFFSGPARCARWRSSSRRRARDRLHALPQRLPVPGDDPSTAAVFWLPIVCAVWLPDGRGVRARPPGRRAPRGREAHGRGGPLGRHGHHGVSEGDRGARAFEDAVEELPLVDHHVHGALRIPLDRDGVRAQGSPSPPRLAPGTSAFDSQVGLRDPSMVRAGARPRTACRPRQYIAARAKLGPDETNRQLLGPSGVVALPGRHRLRDG